MNNQNWISVEERLPDNLETVWISNGEGWTSLGCWSIFDEDGTWSWAEHNGVIYEDEGKIVAECEFEDLDVRYWHPLPGAVEDKFFGFFKMKISNQEMAKVMYALLSTRSKLVSSSSEELRKYDRKQTTRFSVNVVVEIHPQDRPLFEELAGVQLLSSNEFQGDIRVN